MMESEQSYEYEDADSGHSADFFEREVSKCLTAEEVLFALQQEITHIATVLQCPKDHAQMLLSTEKYRVDLALERALENNREGLHLQRVTTEGKECGQCLQDVVGEAFECAGCKAFLCEPCIVEMIRYGLQNFSTRCAVYCAGAGCPMQLGFEAMEECCRTAPDLLKLYRLRLAQAVSAALKYVPCSTANCGTFFVIHSGTASEARCKLCGEFTCTLCPGEGHLPATCVMMKKWTEKDTAESATSKWFVVNTKACPKCREKIQKNGGCNHMTCHCHHEWCWVCTKPWSMHGSSYYKCNYFSADAAADESRATHEKSLTRYVHYYERYHNHHQSRLGDQQTLSRIKVAVAELQRERGYSFGEASFLEDTAKTLHMCRTTLRNSYVYAYYLHDGSSKNLFEFNQAQLEYCTEELSRVIEAPPARLDRSAVISTTRQATQRLEKLKEGCIQMGAITSLNES